MILYAYYVQGIFCKSLFHNRIWFFMHIMFKEYSASLCSMRDYDFLGVGWCSNILQVFVPWENMIFYAYDDAAIFCKSLFHKRIWFFMRTMIQQYSASLCSVWDYDFLGVGWCSNILQVFVQWENMIFYAYDDAAIFCKSLFNERIWFFMRMMMQQYSASLGSTREYDFSCILWSRNILQVFVPRENMIFYAYYDWGIFCKSLFDERKWFFMHIMTKEYSASLNSMREYDFLCILWLRNILQVFVQWQIMIF
jgi:hypothetical protein